MQVDTYRFVFMSVACMYVCILGPFMHVGSEASAQPRENYTAHSTDLSSLFLLCNRDYLPP